MDTIPNGPLDDIKKLGDILMRRTSEKGKYLWRYRIKRLFPEWLWFQLLLFFILINRIFGFYLEYYRFLHIQEQCRLKWQATIDKFTQLLKEHQKCVMEKNDLAANLKHIGHLWETEKEFRRSMEYERNLYVSRFLFQVFRI